MIPHKVCGTFRIYRLFLPSTDQRPAPNANKIRHPANTASGKFHPGPLVETKPMPKVNFVTYIAPSMIITSPADAHLVKNPSKSAVAPSGSAIERTLVVNSRNAEMPWGAPDQKGNL